MSKELDAARETLAGMRLQASRPPAHIVDQIEAAANEARASFGRAAAAWSDEWSEVLEVADRDDLKARVLLALSHCTPCDHLDPDRPRAAWANLGWHEIACGPCTRIPHERPQGEADRCDWCGGRGVTWFESVAVRVALVVVMGDACPECRAGLAEAARPRR